MKGTQGEINMDGWDGITDNDITYSEEWDG